jgi:hypothetical protein
MPYQSWMKGRGTSAREAQQAARNSAMARAGKHDVEVFTVTFADGSTRQLCAPSSYQRNERLQDTLEATPNVVSYTSEWIITTTLDGYDDSSIEL